MKNRIRRIVSAAVMATLTAASLAVVVIVPPPDARLPELRPTPADEHARTIQGMRPPRRTRPAIAVIAQNAGTETTDFIIPYAVLVASGAADVVAVAPTEDAIQLTPALKVEPQATTAAFDERYPEGADYVIVPKIQDAADAAVVAWIKAQAVKGATIVGICSGVKTVSAAGLLEGRDATGHWYDLEELRKANPTMRWVRDRRYVADGNVITTTGVSASVPASLALVEAIAGRPRAAELAAELGVSYWDARHDSAAFSLDRRMLQTALGNRYAFWARETYALPVADGADDISVAFAADAWSRTFRSQVLAVSGGVARIQTRHGLALIADAVGDAAAGDALAAPRTSEPARQLDESLEGIAHRYGEDTALFVALQLEYAWRPADDKRADGR